MGANSLPKTVTRQRRSCDLNPGPSAPESSTQTTRLPSHPYIVDYFCKTQGRRQGEAWGLSPPTIEISPPPQHDGRNSATYELPQNIYSAIQTLIVVCTVVFFVPIHTQCTQLWFVVY